ncbi:MAG: conserved phage C-terminal domain-containing protein [Mycoplasmatota bacterium]|nr:conserved phage C-terminal domain-containing protein [Mycoplasmatota bacterium]
MAQKRMFDRNITTNDDFLELSAQAQCIYFYIGIVADDDGLTKNYKSYMKLIGATDKDLQSLIDKSFIYKFDSDVIAIRHWKINNTIRNDRYRPTMFQNEFSKLVIADNNEYILLETNGIPDDNQVDTQNSIDKNSKDKISIDENSLEKKSKEKNNIVEKREDIIILSGNDIVVKDVIDYLNNKINSSYNWENKKIKELVNNWIEKGYKKLDFQIVIDKKFDEWKDTKMVVHLNPYTLFGDKFENYYNQPVKKKTLNDISMKELEEMIEARQNGEENENDPFSFY